MTLDVRNNEEKSQFETTIDDLVDQAFGVSSDGEFG